MLYEKKALHTARMSVQLGVFIDRTHIVLPEASDFTYRKRWQADARGCCPVLQSRIRVCLFRKRLWPGDNAPSNRITVGGLGSEGDKTVLLGPKNWNPISSSKWTVLARHG